MSSKRSASRVEYMGRLLDGVDFVLSGRKGAVADDRWLQNHYDARFADLLLKQLEHSDPRIRSETVLLLGRVGERSALDAVRTLRRHDVDVVSASCLAYLTRLDEEDQLVPQLLDVLNTQGGKEFKDAVRQMARVGRDEDIPPLREILEGLHDERGDLVLEAIDKIVDRYPELQDRRILLCSRPVFPNEESLSRFIERGVDYIDRRYRENILPRKQVRYVTLRNLVKALQEIHVRLYNEEKNLPLYSQELQERHEELLELLDWAYQDLQGKQIADPAGSDRCRDCGGSLHLWDGGWVCSSCGRSA